MPNLQARPMTACDDLIMQNHSEELPRHRAENCVPVEPEQMGLHVRDNLGRTHPLPTQRIAHPDRDRHKKRRATAGRIAKATAGKIYAGSLEIME